MDQLLNFEHFNSNDEPSSERTNNDIIACISRHKLFVAVVSLFLLTTGTVGLLAFPKSYTADGSVLVDSAEPEAVNLGRVLPTNPLERDTLASEVEILGSRQLLEKVVTELNLVSKLEFNPALQPSTLSKIKTAISDAARDWLSSNSPAKENVPASDKAIEDSINVVKQHLAVDQIGQSRIIKVSYSSADPETAAQVVNTLIHEFITYQIHSREQLGSKAHEWISQRLNDLSLRASESARAVEEYRSSHGLTRGKDTTTLVQDEITQVNIALSVARQQRDEAESALKEANSAGRNHDWDHLSEVLGSQLIQKLREQEAQATGRLAELGSKYDPNSPMLDPVKAQLAGINRMIQSESDRIARSISNKVSVAKSNEFALTLRLEQLKAQIANMDADLVPLQKLERQAAVDRDLYTSFLSRSKETDPWLDYPAARVRSLSPAPTPIKASFPNMMIALPILCISSLSFAVIGTLLLESRRRGFLSMDSVDKYLGVPSLGLIPLGRKRNLERDGAFCEAISVLFSRTTQDADKGPCRSLLVTSAVPGEGKSTTSLAFAREGASRGLRILLIDADMRSRSLSDRASRDGTIPGLAEVLRGEVSLDAAIRQPAALGVAFLSAGSPSSSPAHLLGLPSLKKALDAAENRYDLVVIDSPPVLAGADAWLVGRNTSTTIMLTRWRHTPIKRAALAVKLLAVSHSKLGGVVLSMVNVNENVRYDHADAILFSAAMRRYYSERPTIAFDRPNHAITAKAGPE